MSQNEGARIRCQLIDALEADLIGPFAGRASTAEEVLSLPPSRWYLTGFLAPERCRSAEDPTSDDQLGVGLDEDDDVPAGAEPDLKQRPRYPASIGLSVILPPTPSSARDVLRVEVRFAAYRLVELVDEGGKKSKAAEWHRTRHAPPALDVPLKADSLQVDLMVPDCPGVRIVGKLERADAHGLKPGARALSLFLVNRRVPEGDKHIDRDFLFQVELALTYEPGFLPRPNRQGENASDWDDRVADLQFRDRAEYAVGHGIAAEVPEGQGAHVTRVKTTWLPRQEVRSVVTRPDDAFETKMEALASLTDGGAARTCLTPLVDDYGTWLQGQLAVPVDGEPRKQTQRALVQKAEHARERIRSGIERLVREPDVLEAFRLTNLAMATSALQRSPGRYNETERPRWRLFQLAFLLLNLDGIAEPTHEDREQVDLIFFPTGGGKTEAYLGVIAFTLLLRRMRGQLRPDRGLGVAVLLRYTLRLLTLDQLGRAATLICALEALRKGAPDCLGQERFAVGLWVGKSATANTLGELKRLVIDYKNNTSTTATSPFPLTNCPWCNAQLGKDSLTLVPSATRTESIVVGCSNHRCDYAASKNRAGLPVLFVDDQIYRELPSFLIATVDKFAMLPWRAETAMLFGRALASDGERFYGPADGTPKRATPLPDGLLPPDLIVQDELHLISGPLGTMVGLYETAIDSLSTRLHDTRAVRPKVLASTATVRRAREQIRALFARDMQLFPPPGVDDSETWFARVDEQNPGRLYVGVAAPGRALKGILLRTYVDLLAAAERAYTPASIKLADPYMTLAGYFNALRELGGMRRLVEDEALQRSRHIEDRRPKSSIGPNPWFKNRTLRFEPVELTSRETTAKIKEAKDRLSQAHSHEQHVDVLLASNMISVGVDIDRLGLMVIAGQPKTTAEYIQASSRVGRQHPGLVVTVFNTMKPRDRSHYERFSAYHASFYRFVEATSVTPFSGPALTRGLAGTLVAMTRLGEPDLTAPEGAMRIARHRNAVGGDAARTLSERAGAHRDLEAAEHDRLVRNVRDRAEALLDDWEKLVRSAQEEGAAQRQYSPFDREPGAGRAILSTAIDDQSTRTEEESHFIAPTSMRDVEESVHLWLERRVLGGKHS